MGEAVGVLDWVRSWFHLPEADEAEEELRKQRERSRQVKSGMEDAAARLKRSREAVVEKVRAIEDSIPPEDAVEALGEDDAERILEGRKKLQSSAG